MLFPQDHKFRVFFPELNYVLEFEAQGTKMDISHISHAHGAYRTSSCPDLPGQRPAEWDPTALTTIALASGSGGEVTKGRQMHKVIS